MSKPACLEVGGSNVSIGGVKIVRENAFFVRWCFQDSLCTRTRSAENLCDTHG